MMCVRVTLIIAGVFGFYRFFSVYPCVNDDAFSLFEEPFATTNPGLGSHVVGDVTDVACCTFMYF